MAAASVQHPPAPAAAGPKVPASAQKPIHAKAAKDQGGQAETVRENANGQTEDGVASETEDGYDSGQDAGGDQQGAVPNGATDHVQPAQSTTDGASEGLADEHDAQQEDDGDDEEGEDVVLVGSVQNDGSIKSSDGQIIGRIDGNADPKKLTGSMVDEAGDVLNAAGDIIGKAVPNADGAADDAKDDIDGTGQVAGDVKQTSSDGAIDGVKDAVGSVGQQVGDKVDNAVPDFDLSKPLQFGDDGSVKDVSGNAVGTLIEGKKDDLANATLESVTPQGELIGENGSVLGKVQLPQEAKELADNVGTQTKDLAGINLEKPLSFDEKNNVTNADGNTLGQLEEGDPKKLAETTLKSISTDGNLIGQDGSVVGRVQLPAEASDVTKDVEDQTDALPGVDLSKPLSIDEDKNVTDVAGTTLGKLVEGDSKELSEQNLERIEQDGALIDQNGQRIGKLELPADADHEDAESQIDNSVLQGKTVNKNGNIVDVDGNVWGRLVGGDAKKLSGRMCDSEGVIWDDSGNKVGQGEALPENERKTGSEAPFESFPDAKVQRNGDVISDGAVVGKVVEGDLKKCEGKNVDADGDVSDRNGNTIGRAERIEEEPEPEPEPEKDQSLLAGKRVNKQGNVVDEHGSLFGRVVEGDLKKVAGKMCGKDGTIWNESGEAVGRAELLPESERESKEDGPFANYEGCKVQKDGKVVSSPGGEVIGRLVEGDAKQLAGYTVDADGDVLDSNGNSLGKAERWEEEEASKQKHPCAGLKVNSDGNVVSDETGDIIGKLTEGTLEQCRGIEIDDDGDISNQKNQRIGHVTRIQDIQPEKTQEELDEEERQRKEAEDADQDAKLVKSMSYKIEEAMDKVKPILRDITNYINEMEATKEEDRDEEKLVKQVKPLLEEGGAILDDLNKEIRSMDPDGRIQTQAKTKAAQREATPEEHKLAEQLKEMTGEVHRTIENGKKKIAGMPHAKKEINPLWGLLNEPLFQILAAVGLLLSGVLGLVGKLLGGLGLGGLVDNLLGNLGLDKILKGVGLG